MWPQGQSVAALTDAAQGFAPFAPGLPHRRSTAFDGLPFMSSSAGSLAAMAMNSQILNAYGGMGLMPFGLGHGQNVYDRLVNQRFTQMQLETVRLAAEMDRANFTNTFRGFAAVTGTPFGAEQRRFAARAANALSVVSPIFVDAFPELLDQAGGERGSAALMARRVIDMGRYRMDPVTGRMGMSDVTTAFVSQQMFRDMFADDAIARMRGVTAGQAGNLLAQLQSRGMVETAAGGSGFGGFRGDDQRSELLRAVRDMSWSDPSGLRKAAAASGIDLSGGIGRLSGAEMDKLLADPGISSRLRGFDSQRLTQTVRRYTDAIVAIKEIFGDAGQPNAPMSQLFSALEAMTNNSITQIDPSRLSMMVRQTYNLAKMGGVPLDNAFLAQQHASARGAMLGLEPVFGITALQGGLAFGNAFRGLGLGSHVGWGGMTADQLQQFDINLRQSAAGSNAANRLGVLRRAAMMGAISPGSDADALSRALSVGLDEWVDRAGNRRSVTLSDSQLTDLLANGSRLSASDVNLMLGQHAMNRQQIFNDGLADVIRRRQGRDEVFPFVGEVMEATMAGRFREKFGERGVAAASAITRRLTDRTFAMSHRTFASDSARTAEMANIMREELLAGGFGDLLNQMSPAAVGDFLRDTATIAYGQSNRALQEGRYATSMQNAFAAHNQTVLNGGDRAMAAAAAKARLQDMFSGLGAGTFLSRTISELQNAKPGTPAMEILAAAAGGVRMDTINARLAPQLDNVGRALAKVRAAQAVVDAETDPIKKADAQSQLLSMERALAGELEGLRQVGERSGLYTQDALDPADISKGSAALIDLITARNDLVGLRGGFGAEVTAGQRAGFTGTDYRVNPGAATAEGREIIAARRDTIIRDLEEYFSGRIDSPRSQDSIAALHQHIQMLPAGQTWSSERAKQFAAYKLMVGLRGTINDQEAMTTTAISDADKDAVIRYRRRQVPLFADEEKVKEIMAGGVSRAEAIELQKARQRADRLGIDKAEIQRRMQDKGLAGPAGEVEAIGLAFAERSEARFQITDADIAAFRASPPPGMSAVDLADPEKVRSGILKARLVEHNALMEGFWREEGTAFQQSAEVALSTMESQAEKLLRNPNFAARMGTQAFDIAEALGGGARRFRELAAIYTGGDLSKLLAGQYSLGTTKEDIRIRAGLDREISVGLKQMLAAYGTATDAMGKEGRMFRGDSREEAAKLLNLPKIGPLRPEDETRLNKLTSEIAIYRRINPEQEKTILAYQDAARKAADLQKRYGMSAEVLAEGGPVMAPVSEGMRTLARTLIADRDTKLAEAKQVAAALGVSVDELKGLSNVGELIERTRRDYNLEQLAPDKQAAKLASVAGLPAADAQLKGLEIELSGSRGAAAGRVAADALTRLRKAASHVGALDGASLSSMLALWARSKGDAAAMGEFRKSHGLTDDEEYARFAEAARFSQKTGIHTATSLEELTRSIATAAKDIPATGATSGDKREMYLTGELDVTITDHGSKGKLTGISRDFAPE